MSKSKVIITGGSGFLGKAVNKTLKGNLFYDVVSLGGKREYDLTNQKQVAVVNAMSNSALCGNTTFDWVLILLPLLGLSMDMKKCFPAL